MSREVLHKDLQVSVKQCIQTVTIQRKSNTTKTGKLSQKNQTQTEWQYNTGLRGTITRNDFSWFITTNRPFHHKIILFLAAVVYFGSAHKQLWALRAQMKNKGCRKSTVITYYSLPTFGFFYCDVLKTLKENSVYADTQQCSIFAPPCLDYLPQMKCWLNGQYFDTQDHVWFPSGFVLFHYWSGSFQFWSISV